ncbi:uncharacterized protein LOC144499037 [Mustelus asterias]
MDERAVLVEKSKFQQHYNPFYTFSISDLKYYSIGGHAFSNLGPKLSTAGDSSQEPTPRFSEGAPTRLPDGMEQRQNAPSSHSSTKPSSRVTIPAWDTVAALASASSLQKRREQQCRKKMNDLLHSARDNLNHKKCEQARAAGVMPDLRTFTQFEERVLELAGEEEERAHVTDQAARTILVTPETQRTRVALRGTSSTPPLKRCHSCHRTWHQRRYSHLGAEKKPLNSLPRMEAAASSVQEASYWSSSFESPPRVLHRTAGQSVVQCSLSPPPALWLDVNFEKARQGKSKVNLQFVAEEQNPVTDLEMASREDSTDEEDSYGDDNYSDDYDDSNEGASGSDTDSLTGGESDEERFRGSQAERTASTPCKYYNEGKCKNRNCTYLHVCKYYFNGNCKYRGSCRLSHRMSSDTESSSSSDEATPGRTKRQPAGKHYQWQIKDRKGWNDIKCDHIIEAQYSMPETKGIKLYNSKYGMIAIDFNKMQVRGKDLQVQRKTFANSAEKDEWLWYYRCKHKWKKFSAKGKTIRSADIESQYQGDRRRSIPITFNHKSYKICFRSMMQINLVSGTKRRLKRRPKLQTMRAECSLSDSMTRLNFSGQRQQYRWQFSGNHDNWYDYKKRGGTNTECSVTSEEIESEYLQNQSGCMTFFVNNEKFELDFPAMMQTNLSTGATRSVRRISLLLLGTGKTRLLVRTLGNSWRPLMEHYFSSEAAESSLGVKAFQWQIHSGDQWLDVAHDEIIEAQYTLPTAEGIYLHTAQYGTIHLDFDKMEIVGNSFKLQRLEFPQAQEMSEYSWYFLDDHFWREYGVQGTGRKTSTVTSSDLEHQFQTAPQSIYRFQVGNSSYTINFPAMIQTNVQTGMTRKVRRRSRFTPESQNANSVLDANLTLSPPPVAGTGCIWQFRGDDDYWLDYRSRGEGGICSLNGQDIEQSYQLNPQGSLQFAAGRFQYKLDFSAMTQTNLSIGTKRAVRRLVTPSLGGVSGSAVKRVWQFMDDFGLWKEYSQPGVRKSVLSQDIERSYQMNPQGSMTFTTGPFVYSLDFSAMTQTNLTTKKVRQVRRL